MLGCNYYTTTTTLLQNNTQNCMSCLSFLFGAPFFSSSFCLTTSFFFLFSSSMFVLSWSLSSKRERASLQCTMPWQQHSRFVCMCVPLSTTDVIPPTFQSLMPFIDFHIVQFLLFFSYQFACSNLIICRVFFRKAKKQKDDNSSLTQETHLLKSTNDKAIWHRTTTTTRKRLKNNLTRCLRAKIHLKSRKRE